MRFEERANDLRRPASKSPRLEARLLFAHAMGVSQEDIIAGRIVPDAAALVRLDDLLQRRGQHEPIAYILGTREFWSLPFAVGPGVLIPRPETELLVGEALRHFPERDAALRVLDLGTGSGCLLLAFLSERPCAQGLGIDISADALHWAKRNAHNLKMENRTEFLRCDFGAPLFGTFDVVLANPPYIERGDIARLDLDVRAHEPQIALDGGPDGLDCYRKIAAFLPRLLAPKGRALVELGRDEAEPVREIFAGCGLGIEGIVKDLAYIPRCLVASAPAKAPHVKRKKQMEKETRSGYFPAAGDMKGSGRRESSRATADRSARDLRRPSCKESSR